MRLTPRMIPYFSLTEIPLGPITLHVWGLLLAIGFVVGSFAAGWVAKRRGLKTGIVYDLVPWLAIASMVGGRLGHVLFYEPAYFVAHPAEIFAIWHGGLSVFGGIFACIAVSIFYLHKKRVDLHSYADVLIFGLPFGKIFGRLGCFLIHDHPGTLTHTVLGVKYSNGEVRHDLGLYLALNAFLMSLFFIFLARRPRRQGIYIVAFSLWYGTARFFLDFLRIVDVRYGGLTPGQYFSIALVFFGLFYALWITKRAKKPETR
jgi:phosphatidylglycerol---prolipoprotein diacylglyceryl transferase